MSTDTDLAIERLKHELVDLHRELIRWNLVVWTSGNVSARVPGADLMVIKPSGVSYDDLTADMMVVTDLWGNVTSGELAPSSDTFAHAYIYRQMPQVGGVVHTHSSYATAWAAARLTIPCALTMMADEFGGDIPVGPFELIGDDAIGRGVVETLAKSPSRAVLMANHGVFAVGADARAAVKSAVLCEEAAKTVLLAGQVVALGGIGAPRLRTKDIEQLHRRYQHDYGQKGK